MTTPTPPRSDVAGDRPARRRRHVGAAVVVSVAATLLVGATPAVAGPTGPPGPTGPATAAGQAAPLCGRFDAAPVDGGRYLVQNNRWSTDAAQCVAPRDGGFVLERADGAVTPAGPPKSYPSVVAGCHWGRCSTAPGLPVRADRVGGARTAVSVQRSPGAWNVAYDLWFDSREHPTGQNDDAEVMIWLDRRGGVQPLGAPVGRLEAEGASWTVWRGLAAGEGASWDVVSFVRDSRTSHADLALGPFVAEAVRLGALGSGSWLTSVQVGFEPWSAGAGLAVKGFSFEPDPAAG